MSKVIPFPIEHEHYHICCPKCSEADWTVLSPIKASVIGHIVCTDCGGSFRITDGVIGEFKEGGE
jgi:uncharacterized protein YbaR (Trm112 family)